MELFHARARRRFQRGISRKPLTLIKKLRKAKKNAPEGERPEPVRTHLRNMIVVPEMIGSVIAVYNGKTFNQVEIKVRQSAFPLEGLEVEGRSSRWMRAGRHGGPLPRRVQHLVQASEARQAWRWRYQLFPLHPAQVSHRTLIICRLFLPFFPPDFACKEHE